MNVFPTKVLLATDASEEVELALQTAVGLTKKTGSELHVVHVGHLARYAGVAALGGRGPLPSAQDTLDNEARRLLESQVKKIEAAGSVVAYAHLRASERPDAEIVSVAEEIDAGLIAVGSRGLGGMTRALMGSISDSVVRHAHCPVMVVRKAEEEQYMGVFPTRILLATDGSEDAELALGSAVDLANSTGSELHLITVGGRSYPRHLVRHPELVDETLRELEREARETLDEQVRKVEEAGGDVTGQHLAVGNPAEKILNQAHEVAAGLIVLGSRGWGGIRRALMGSVSDSVVRHASCPVLIVREKKR